MRFAKPLAVIILTLSALGCRVSTIHPLYSDTVAAHDPALVGTWAVENGKMSLVISEDGDSYRVVFDSPDRNAVYSAKLVQLGNRRFVDCWPTKPSGPDAIPVHHIFRVDLDGDTLKLATPEPKKVETLVGLNDPLVPLARLDDGRILFTGSTEQNQAFFRRHDDDIFRNILKVKRQPSPSTK